MKATSMLVAAALASASAADNPAFMLISGISGPSEMCVSALGGFVAVAVGLPICVCFHEKGVAALEPCAAAVASGEGRELWFV